MHSHEIPTSEWAPFFDELSRKHHGEHVTVELVGRNIGDQPQASDQSLMGIAVDRPTGACKIDVMVGGLAAANISHEIAHPIHVRLSQSDDGKDAAVEIEMESGPRTVLRFDA